jgi:hypothetical protein
VRIALDPQSKATRFALLWWFGLRHSTPSAAMMEVTYKLKAIIAVISIFVSVWGAEERRSSLMPVPVLWNHILVGCGVVFGRRGGFICGSFRVR